MQMGSLQRVSFHRAVGMTIVNEEVHVLPGRRTIAI